MSDNRLIGIVGGMGPYAGVDLARKIFDETIAATDQEHLPVALLSIPHKIVDRSIFLNGQTDTNPAEAILEILRMLETSGAVVAGIPCNTAHAPSIFHRIVDGIEREHLRIKLLHIVDENARYIKEHLHGVTKVGLLATAATVRHRIYCNALEARGLQCVSPSHGDECALVNDAIYHEHFGIKAFSNPVTDRARSILLGTIRVLARRGADAVILGCTELPLAVPEVEIEGIPVIDSTRVLARALIREVAPGKLRSVRPALPQSA